MPGISPALWGQCKSKTLLMSMAIPEGGGTVVTNDLCIICYDFQLLINFDFDFMELPEQWHHLGYRELPYPQPQGQAS